MYCSRSDKQDLVLVLQKPVIYYSKLQVLDKNNPLVEKVVSEVALNKTRIPARLELKEGEHYKVLKKLGAGDEEGSEGRQL